MTAAANGMDISAERIADVWSYLGDKSASGADEIGIAMQKVAASAEMAGVSFEWLGAYIATISEKTRLAPEAVGTALNSMISRLQQIKQQGYNSEDSFGLNDIAEALSNIDVSIMDELTGEWRAWPDILNEIAMQWQNLDAKTQGYIATTMAGTRQRNYFLTLMEDLSLGAEGGSRAWELYSGALNSAGTAMQKYAIWEESVEAAQNRLTAELEEFYAILSGEHIKNWYDGLAYVMNSINDVTDATGGMNIALGVSAAAVAMLTLVFIKLKAEASSASVGLGKQIVAALTGVTTSATGATVATNTLGMALRSVGFGIAVAGIVHLVTWLISFHETAEVAAEKTAELADELNQSFSESGKISEFASKIETLGKKTSYTNEDIAIFNQLRQEMIAVFPELAEKLGNEATMVEELAGKYEDMAAAIEEANKQRFYEQWNKAHDGIDSAEMSLRRAYDKQGKSNDSMSIALNEALTEDAFSMGEMNPLYFDNHARSLEELRLQADLGRKGLSELSATI